MAVAFDAKMTAGNGPDSPAGCYQYATGTSISSTGMTIGSGATCLIAVLTIWTNGGTIPSATATWNSISMNPGATISSNSYVAVYIFYLVNPDSGNHTLAASWGTSYQAYLSCVSFTGTDTTTPFNVADNVTATDQTSITVTSDAAGATVAIELDNGTTPPSCNFTKIYHAGNLNPNSEASYTLGGTSNVHTFGSPNGYIALAGIHVVAPSAAPATNNDRRSIRAHRLPFLRIPPCPDGTIT